MLPYFPQPVWMIGRVQVHAFGVLIAVALGVGYLVMFHRARRAGLDLREVAIYYLAVLVGGLAGTAMGYVLSGSALATLYLILGCIIGAVTCCSVRLYARTRCREFLDVAAFAAPFAAAAARLGCTLAHDHRGIPSTGWLAFNFPEGPRYDLGFIEFLFSVAGAAVFLFLDRKRRPPLFFFVTGLLFYGAFRIYRNTLD
jgi:phosphatidylglycerol:prolipoprotein diacylglycerol transferase